MTKTKFSKVLAVTICFMMLIIMMPNTAVTVNAAYENTHTNTGNQREDIVAVAETQIGYVEGSNNYTKYNVWNGLISGYPENGYGYPWCHAFVSWCANQAGISTDIIPRTAGTSTGKAFFTSRGLWYNSAYQGGSYTPQRGDIIYYSDSASLSNPTHVGIVTSCTGGYVYTVEGNYSDSVKTRSIAISNSYIIGYGVPNYKNPTPPDTPQPKISKMLFSADEDVNVTWNAAANSTGYWLHTYRNGEDFENKDIYNSLSYSRKYPVGKYTLYITSYNGTAEKSACVEFTVYDSAPVSPQPKISKTLFSAEESVNVTWNATANTTHYWLHSYKDGKDFENKDMYNNLSYSRTYPAGRYTLYIAAYNNYGYNAKCVEFTVYDTKPEAPNLKIDKTSYTIDESVDITWNSVSNTTHYWLLITRNGESYKSQSLEQALTYKEQFPEGTYDVYISAVNAYGFTAGNIAFTVGDTMTANTTNTTTTSTTTTSTTTTTATASELPITLDKTELTLENGEQYTIVTNQENLTYKSNNTNVAVVSKSGIITAIGTGNAVISVINTEGDVAQIKVTVFSVTIVGDCNNDREFTVADVVLLQKWLLAIPDTHLTNWQAADLCDDGKLDVFDLVMMKRKLING